MTVPSNNLARLGLLARAHCCGKVAAPCRGSSAQAFKGTWQRHSTSTQASRAHTAAEQRPSPKLTQQRHKHPSSQAHTAAPAPKLRSAHSSSTLQRHEHPSSRKHTRSSSYTGWNSSGTLQQHQHPGSKTHACSSSYILEVRTPIFNSSRYLGKIWEHIVQSPAFWGWGVQHYTQEMRLIASKTVEGAGASYS